MRDLSEEEIETIAGAIAPFIPESFGWWDDWWKKRRPPRINIDDLSS